MFYTLFFGTFVISITTSLLCIKIFKKPIKGIMQRIIGEEIHLAWCRYMYFALTVVGISSGVRIYHLERYINKDHNGNTQELSNPALTLEIYRTVIGALQGIAWVLLIFFCFALVAYVIVKSVELIKQVKTNKVGSDLLMNPESGV